MNKRKQLEAFDLRLINFLRRWHIPLARLALFIVFFWFGVIKVIGLSPATPLAVMLTERTIGAEHFTTLFFILTLLECFIGVLFLLPNATRVVIPLLLLHMVLVCSPLILVSEMTWSGFMIPTLEGQYIIKNAVIVALAIGIASHTKPLLTREQG